MPKALPAVLAQILFLLCEIWKILRRIFFGGVRGYPKSSKRSFNNPWSNGSWDHSLVSDADNDKAQLPFCLHFYVFVGVFLNLNSTPDSESREGCHDGMCTHTHTHPGSSFPPQTHRADICDISPRLPPHFCNQDVKSCPHFIYYQGLLLFCSPSGPYSLLPVAF